LWTLAVEPEEQLREMKNFAIAEVYLDEILIVGVFLEFPEVELIENI